MTQAVLSVSQPVQFGGLKGYVGAYTDQANFQQPDWNGVSSLWQSFTGIAREGGVTRYYAGNPPWTFDANLQEMAKNGVRIAISFSPVSPVVPDPVNLASISNVLTALKNAGADCVVSIRHEPFYNGWTAAQYVAAVQYYSPVIRQFYPFWCVFSGNDTIETNGYYPGDSYVDGIAVDAYFTPNYNYASNDLTNAAAMADNHSKALAIWEYGSTRGPNFLTGDNHTFAATTGNWTQDANCVLSHSTAVNPFGVQTGALGITASAAGNMSAKSGSAASFATTMQPCAAGDEITVGSWVQANSVSRTCVAGSNFYTSAGTFVSTVYSTDSTATTSDPVGSWAPVTGKLTAPATAEFYALTVQVQGCAAGEFHRIGMAYSADSSTTGHTQAGATTWWQFVQSTMTNRLSAHKPNGDLILFNGGMPGNSNMDAIQYSNDYRIGLWQAIYNALNNQVYGGSLAQYTGQGSCSIGPTGQGEVWNAGFTVSVHCSSNNQEAICKIYCGDSISPVNFVDGTTWGSTGDSSTNTPEVRTGQSVYAVWAGADPFSTGYLNVNGTRTVA